MQHGSINFSWVLIQVLKLKSDHPDPQSTVDSHMCPLTKKVIISVLQLMSCLSKCLNPTTSHLYAYVPTWMMPVKTCRKSPPPLFHVYSILYSCRSCACLVAALTCLPAPPVDLAALSVLLRHTLRGQWNRQKEVDCTR